MSPVRGRHVEIRLPAYLTGELTEADAKEIEAHLESCDRCSEALRELRGLRKTLASEPRPVPLRPVWPAVADRLRPAASGRIGFQFAMSAAGAAAAGIVLGVVLGAYGGAAEAEPSYPLWTAVGSSFSGEGSIISQVYEEVPTDGDR